MSKNLIYYSSLFFLLATVVGVIFYFGNSNKLSLVNGHVDTETNYVDSFFHTFESQDTKALSATLDVVLQDSGLKKVFLKQDREELNKYSQPLFQRLKAGYGITHFYFMLPDGVTFLRLHNPTIYNDINNRITFKKAVESKTIGFGIELGKTAFALRVVKPYYDGDKLIGYIELGQEIDHFLSVLKNETKNEYSIFVNKDKLNPTDWEASRKNSNKANNWDNFSKMIATNSTVDLENITDESARFCFSENNSQTFFSTKPENSSIINLDLKIACSGILIQDASGGNVGVLLFIHDISDRIISYSGFINSINILVVVVIILTIISTIYVSRKSFAIENKFKALFENSIDAIMMINPPNWKFSDGNKATLKLFGLKNIKELQSITPGDLSPKYQPDGKLSSEKAKKMIEEALQKGKNSFEWTHKKLNGPEFIAQVSLSKIENYDGLQALVRDITDQKTAFDIVKQSEDKVKKALIESETLNKYMVGRELKMVELKRQINEQNKK